MLDRLLCGSPAQSMILVGLHGVGKTALLNEFEDAAVERDWIAVRLDLDAEASLPDAIAMGTRRALLELKPTRKVAERVRLALGDLGMFVLKGPDEFELSYRPRAQTLPDRLGEDFTDLLQALGEAAVARESGVAFLLDEAQYAAAREFGAVTEGLYRMSQRALPVTCLAAGLPTLPALTGRARTYAEHIFDYRFIDRLSKADACAALAAPASKLEVSWEDQALAYVFGQTSGYPYSLQEHGRCAWDLATEKRITEADARAAGRLARDHLDDGFYGVRFEGRATPAEREFLRAMAGCDGPPYSMAEVTHALGKKDQRSLSMRRDSLMSKGLIYAPKHGFVDYAVPGFADYLDRQDPVEPTFAARHVGPTRRRQP